MRQSLTSQMIDGVFPPKPVSLDLRPKAAPPIKTCVRCFTVIMSAAHQCHECGEMQPCWYRRQEKLGHDAKAVQKVSE